jgi:hypothetical protein
MSALVLFPRIIQPVIVFSLLSRKPIKIEGLEVEFHFFRVFWAARVFAPDISVGDQFRETACTTI